MKVDLETEKKTAGEPTPEQSPAVEASVPEQKNPKRKNVLEMTLQTIQKNTTDKGLSGDTAAAPSAKETPSKEEVATISAPPEKRAAHKGFTHFLKSMNNIGMGKQRVGFVSNLATMLNAGLPLIDALQTIRLETKSRAMRGVITKILDMVESGQPLWISMDEQGCFTPYEVALVRVGEEAGNLARNMEYLSVQQEKDRNLRQKVKMAMIYPTIVMILMFIVVMGLGMFVLPNLIQVLYSLNVDLPLSTKIVIMFTEFMTAHGFKTGGGIILAFITFLLLSKYTGFKAVSQWLIFRIPGIGRLAREASIARFGVILGGLLQAGVTLPDSLKSLVDVTTIVSFKKFYKKLLDRVVLGDSFATCFHEIKNSRKILPASVQQLVITGEKSGALSDTCIKVATIYEKKAEETAEKLPVILEPILLLCIGSLVGFIAFSIIVPIYSAVGNVSNG